MSSNESSPQSFNGDVKLPSANLKDTQDVGHPLPVSQKLPSVKDTQDVGHPLPVSHQQKQKREASARDARRTKAKCRACRREIASTHVYEVCDCSPAVHTTVHPACADPHQRGHRSQPCREHARAPRSAARHGRTPHCLSAAAGATTLVLAAAAFDLPCAGLGSGSRSWRCFAERQVRRTARTQVEQVAIWTGRECTVHSVIRNTIGKVPWAIPYGGYSIGPTT
ncbi:hypothetical protein GGX14DRAFT_564913 [Mycena pura]|uniref:Uncharacterized protein n=1 Tax=Mycena pura TaxID=153505 RepID=A0AAD6VFR1_9AGAR|nr:hypothetical protein GGX14DRAFT_564913 [Mycena pura]